MYLILGIKDFVPEMVQGGYEPFSNLVKKASRWINEEKAVNVTNFKSVHISRENGNFKSTTIDLYLGYYFKLRSVSLLF